MKTDIEQQLLMVEVNPTRTSESHGKKHALRAVWLLVRFEHWGIPSLRDIPAYGFPEFISGPLAELGH